MSSYVPLPLRRFVARRARNVCEYCLVHEDDTYFGCEIEHIISEKHGGATLRANLAWACALCNRSKGTDIAAVAPASRQICRLYNLRTDKWRHHFRIRRHHIVGITDIGKATVSLLGMNTPARVLERQTLAENGRFPSDMAQKLID